MGRSVSYPSGAIVAFTVLEVESDDDWEFQYDWLREDLRERAAQAFPSDTLTSAAFPANAHAPRIERRLGELRPDVAALCPSIRRLQELQQGLRDGDGRALELLEIYR